jgi:membrane protein involved in colicin uptake
MAEMQRKFEERLAGIPFVDGERISRRAQEAAERVRRQAERAAEKARVKAEKARVKAERAGRRHERHAAGVRWSWSAPQPPKPPKPPAEPVSDAERMAILKMVADKKITADEASRLLAALEGEA